MIEMRTKIISDLQQLSPFVCEEPSPIDQMTGTESHFILKSHSQNRIVIRKSNTNTILTVSP